MTCMTNAGKLYYMKVKVISIRVDEDIVKKMDYLQHLNGYKTRSETVRKVIDKEYNREMFGRAGKDGK